MANVKITDLSALANPASTDVLAIVDVTADITKKVTIADLLENAGDGTDAAPAFSFDSDNNTGLFLAAADKLGFSTNGVGRIYIDGTGKVEVAGTLEVTGATTFANNVTVDGNLTVNGTTTTIDSTTLVVEDKNIEMGAVTTPTDVTADGGGITLKGTTDKTINWVNSTDAWTLSEHVNIASAKEYRIDGTKVLDATSLGSAVVSSSLTSVGTIGTGVWNGTPIATAYIADSSVTSAKIANGTIVDADVNASAGIGLSKLATGSLPTGITIASANIVDGTIIDADVNASAAIGLSKLATGSLPTGITIASANIVDGTIVDADVNASAAIGLSKLATGALPTGITVTSANIADGTIVDADVNASAAIGLSKLATGALPTGITVTSANITKGTIVDADVNASAAIGLSKLATGALPTGITVASANIVDGTIVDADISATAEIAVSKLANGTARQVLQTDAAGTGVEFTDNVDVPGTLDVTGVAVFDSSVGIGSSSPAGKLNVHGSGASPSLTYDTNNIANFDAGGVQLALGIDSASPFTSYLQARDDANNARNISLNPSGGKLGIGTIDPSEKVEISDANPRLRITDSDSAASTSTSYVEFYGNNARSAVIYTDSNGLNLQADSAGPSVLRFLTSGTQERARITSGGKFLVGATAVRGVGNIQASIFGEGTSAAESSIALVRNSNSNGSPFLLFAKTRGTTIGSNTIVQGNDVLGQIKFCGADGTNLHSTAASIDARADGTPGDDDMPGRLVFKTTADGETSPTERMRIDKAGLVTINSGFIRLNGNNVGGIKVTIADDAFAQITPPRIGGGYIAVTEGPDEVFPNSGCHGFIYCDWGDSPTVSAIQLGGLFETATSGTPDGTTGSDDHATLFVGGTSGKIFLENRLGTSGIFALTFT